MAEDGSCSTPGPQYCDALQRLIEVLTDGMQHGHFGCTVSVKIGKRGKREVLLEAGKSYRFMIPAEEIPQLSWAKLAIPGTGTPKMQMKSDPEPSAESRGRGSGTWSAQAGHGASYDDQRDL